MLCKLCDQPLNNYTTCGHCPDCWLRFQEFQDNLPQEWCDILGPCGVVYYEDWETDRYIQKRLFSGDIDQEQADKESERLEAKIRKRCHTDGAPVTPVEKKATFWDMPPTFKRS